LHDTESQLNLVEETTSNTISELRQTITDLQKENEQLRLKASETTSTNHNDILRMEASVLRCDLAASKSELLMCYKQINKLEK